MTWTIVRRSLPAALIPSRSRMSSPAPADRTGDRNSVDTRHAGHNHRLGIRDADIAGDRGGGQVRNIDCRCRCRRRAASPTPASAEKAAEPPVASITPAPVLVIVPPVAVCVELNCSRAVAGRTGRGRNTPNVARVDVDASGSCRQSDGCHWFGPARRYQRSAKHLRR